MKKILSFVISLILIVSSEACINVFAAGSSTGSSGGGGVGGGVGGGSSSMAVDRFNLEMSSADVYKNGNTVTIDIEFEGLPDDTTQTLGEIKALMLYDLSYDKDALEFVSGSVVASPQPTISDVDENGEIVFAYENNTDCNGKIAELTFKSKSKVGTFDIDCKCVVVYERRGKEINVSADLKTLGKITVKNTSGGGSGGGGGGTASKPVTPTVSNGASATASVSGSTVTITKIDVSGVTTDTKDVSIDMSDNKTAISEIKVKKDDIKSVDTLEIKITDATISLDKETLEAIATEAKGTQISIKVSEKSKDKLNEKQKKGISDISLSKIVDVSAASNNKEISNLGNTKITIPFELKTGEIADTTKVWVVDNEGNKTLVDAKYNKADKTVTFEAKNPSVYAMAVENEKDAIILTIGEKETKTFGEIKTNDVAPKIINDRTVLPIRFIAEEFGAVVDWIAETNTVTIKNADVEISLVIGEDNATVNGETVKLDIKSFVENGRTYMPVRFIMESLDTVVDWNAEDEQVIITK